MKEEYKKTMEVLEKMRDYEYANMKGNSAENLTALMVAIAVIKATREEK